MLSSETTLDSYLRESLLAAHTWGELSDSEKRNALHYIRGYPWVGRRRRAREVVRYLEMGPNSIRAFFRPPILRGWTTPMG